MKSYKTHFKKFIEADPKRIHFAAHSHHFWPDVSFDAHMRAWNDAATLADEKWDRVFGKLWPRAQKHVARILKLPDPKTIAFAPNVHELVARVLANLPQKIRVLTTDGEFYSFARQLARLEEADRAEVVRVASRPYETFIDRFRAEASKGAFDLVHVSHVFFDSGYALRELERVVSAAPRDAIVIVDGYHAFCAIDVDLSRLSDRIFYVGGGYKYAMSGEGCCFMHAPPGIFPRPIETGWFAAFFALTNEQTKEIPYAEDGSRFLGATYDPTPLYRFDAVMTLLEREGVTTREIDERAKHLQAMFVEKLEAATRDRPDFPLRARDLLVPVSEPNRGQFLVFQTARAKEIHDTLARANVMTDVRGDRLRFGFAIYHDESDIIEGVERICEAL